MKLPTFKRIVSEEFPEQRKWLPKLIAPLNSFLEQVTQGLNKNITVQDNLDAEIKTITVSEFPYIFSYSKPPKSVTVGKYPSLPTGTGIVTWYYTGTALSVSIDGFSPTQKDKLTFTLLIINN
jgi:hypothetical protein